MKIAIATHLEYFAPQSCDLLLQIVAADYADQHVIDDSLSVDRDALGRTTGEDGIGERVWLRAAGNFVGHYTAQVEVTRPPVNIHLLDQSPLAGLPPDVVKYLMPSRYCFPEDFAAFTATQFGGLTGGTRAAALRDWVEAHFTYDPFATDPKTTASSSFASRRGVCRDYAHTLIAMLRAVGIPARIVSAYAPRVAPPDFHAVVEVYLEDAWHLVDPTGMARAEDIVVIGVGRDAADISFMTSYGVMEMKNQTVAVHQVDNFKQ